MLGNKTGFGGRKGGFSRSPPPLKYFSLASRFVRNGGRTQTHMQRQSLGARLSESSSGLRWRSLQGIAADLRGRTRLERVPGAARLTLQVSENPIDDSGIGDDGDNLHLCAADTEKRIHLENPLDKAGPGCPAPLNELRGGIGRCARACCRWGLLLARGFRRTCAVGERSVIPHAMH